MFKKYLRCFVVSLVLALMVPIVTVEVNTPNEQYGIQGNLTMIEGEEVFVHEVKKIDFIEKITFYFSSQKSFMYYLNIVLIWFIAMFLASAISTFLNGKQR